MSKDIDFENRKRLFEHIKQFNRTEQEELYRILRRSQEEMSENRNGIFFDLMSLKESTIDTIQKWISFCGKNSLDFQSREKEMSELLTENFVA